MNLWNFSGHIDEAVVKRGIDYYESGAVLWIKEKPALTFQGFVQGTKKYTVLVMLDQEDRIAFSSCTCPYNKGPYCKHEAAVYLALQHRLREKQIQKLESLEQLLADQPKETLIKILTDIIAECEELS